MACCFETEEELALILAKVGAPEASELAKKVFAEKEKIDRLRHMAARSLTRDQMRYIQEWQATTVAGKRKRKGKKKTAVQTQYFGEIYQLRQKGYSFAQISRYLARYHRLRVDQSFLYRAFREQMRKLEEAKKSQATADRLP